VFLHRAVLSCKTPSGVLFSKFFLVTTAQTIKGDIGVLKWSEILKNKTATSKNAS